MRHLIYSNSWSLFCFLGTENIGASLGIKMGLLTMEYHAMLILVHFTKDCMGSQRRIPNCITLTGKLLGEWWDYKMLNSNQMIRCSAPTTEKICKLNQKCQHRNLRIHDQNRTSRCACIYYSWMERSSWRNSARESTTCSLLHNFFYSVKNKQ